VHTIPDTLEIIIKDARKKQGLTREQLAEKINITPRYLISIENEKKKPSYDVLFKIIRELAIMSDAIFYPDKPCKDTEIEDLIRMLYNCDERSIQVVRATVKSLLGTYGE